MTCSGKRRTRRHYLPRFGSKLPHILRPALVGTHQLVGEAYVHRYMDGELMDGAVCLTTFKSC
jgi:hypothetical protein